MSFILDALRKSEHERQRATVPGLAQVPLATPTAEMPRWALLVIGLLAAAVLALGTAWWRSAHEPGTVVTAPPAPPPTVERNVQLPPAAPAPPPQPARAFVAEPGEQLGATALGAAADTGTTNAALPAADSEPTAFAAQPVPTPGDEPAAGRDQPALPSAAALMAEGVALPALRLELHAFGEEPRDRFVFINGRKYVEGERLVEGPQVIAIERTGAVLSHAGQRFLLLAE